MTLYLDPETGDLVDGRDGALIATVSGPPFTLPDDAKEAVESQFPSEHSSVSVENLMRTLDVAGGDVEFGTPP